MSGVYVILNKVNGKVYIGSSVNISTRCKDHKKRLDLLKHQNIRLQREWNIYGAKSFIFVAVEVMVNKFKLYVREQWWMDEFDSSDRDYGYNLCPAAGSVLGSTRSKKHNRMISRLQRRRLKNKQYRVFLEQCFKKGRETQRRLGVGSCCNPILREQAQIKGRAAQVLLKTGIHNPKALSKAHATMKRLGVGIYDPAIRAMGPRAVAAKYRMIGG